MLACALELWVLMAVSLRGLTWNVPVSWLSARFTRRRMLFIPPVARTAGEGSLEAEPQGAAQASPRLNLPCTSITSQASQQGTSQVWSDRLGLPVSSITTAHASHAV